MPTDISTWSFSMMKNSLADTKASSDSDVVIGVLALQGAFREHIAHFSKVARSDCARSEKEGGSRWGLTVLSSREVCASFDGSIIAHHCNDQCVCDVYSGPQVCLCEHLHSCIACKLGQRFNPF